MCSIRAVEMTGVNPPKIAVARLYASEKPATRTSTGMISVSADHRAVIEAIEEGEPQQYAQHHGEARCLRQQRQGPDSW